MQESNTQIDKTMLQVKEAQDAIQREASQKRLDDMLENKYAIQRQIDSMKDKESEAKMEYLRERDQVDHVIQRMIDEDREMARIQNLKMQQAQADMILSNNEKRALLRRQEQMD